MFRVPAYGAVLRQAVEARWYRLVGHFAWVEHNVTLLCFAGIISSVAIQGCILHDTTYAYMSGFDIFFLVFFALKWQRPNIYFNFICYSIVANFGELVGVPIFNYLTDTPSANGDLNLPFALVLFSMTAALSMCIHFLDPPVAAFFIFYTLVLESVIGATMLWYNSLTLYGLLCPIGTMFTVTLVHACVTYFHRPNAGTVPINFHDTLHERVPVPSFVQRGSEVHYRNKMFQDLVGQNDQTTVVANLFAPNHVGNILEIIGTPHSRLPVTFRCGLRMGHMCDVTVVPAPSDGQLWMIKLVDGRLDRPLFSASTKAVRLLERLSAASLCGSGMTANEIRGSCLNYLDVQSSIVELRGAMEITEQVQEPITPLPRESHRVLDLVPLVESCLQEDRRVDYRGMQASVLDLPRCHAVANPPALAALLLLLARRGLDAIHRDRGEDARTPVEIHLDDANELITFVVNVGIAQLGPSADDVLIPVALEHVARAIGAQSLRGCAFGGVCITYFVSFRMIRIEHSMTPILNTTPPSPRANPPRSPVEEELARLPQPAHAPRLTAQHAEHARRGSQPAPPEPQRPDSLSPHPPAYTEAVPTTPQSLPNRSLEQPSHVTPPSESAPVSHHAGTPANQPHAAQPHAGAGMQHRVLFVDDEPNQIELLKHQVASINLPIDADYVYSGEDALRMFGEARRVGRPYCMIFIDLILDNTGQGITGSDTIERIANIHVKEGTPNTPIVAMTGHDRWDKGPEMIAKGCAVFMTKPYTKDDLKTNIELFTTRAEQSALSNRSDEAASRHLRALMRKLHPLINQLKDNLSQNEFHLLPNVTEPIFDISRLTPAGEINDTLSDVITMLRGQRGLMPHPNLALRVTELEDLVSKFLEDTAPRNLTDVVIPPTPHPRPAWRQVTPRDDDDDAPPYEDHPQNGVPIPGPPRDIMAGQPEYNRLRHHTGPSSVASGVEDIAADLDLGD